tara:strand:- start:546 stop:695 length:150 start_codon:yes stop_codon:yes gene_type:complete
MSVRLGKAISIFFLVVLNGTKVFNKKLGISLKSRSQKKNAVLREHMLKK